MASESRECEQDIFPPNTPPPELFIGLIGPLGSPTDKMRDFLKAEFEQCGYQPFVVRLSDELARLLPTLSPFEDERTDQLIQAGNKVCSSTGHGNAVARLAIHKVMRQRMDSEERSSKRVWILQSLKRKEEVALLRFVYGDAFFALAVNASYETRVKRYATRLRLTRPTLNEERAKATAVKMIERDESETSESGVQFGQNVRQTFPLADVIVPGDQMNNLEMAIHGFVRLLFGENRVPNFHEHAMYLADGSAALSASLSRRVGACLATEKGEIISVGANEVPKAGGGQYGGEDPDGRDKDLDADYSTLSLRFLAGTTLEVLKDAGWLKDSDDELDKRASDMFEILKQRDAVLVHVIEYMRAVHAEAAAILDAGRRGVPTRGASLYTTTYPCHLCAKEIVAAGIKQVTYIETYPKSRAQSMYGEEIDGNIGCDDSSSRVPFLPFEGVAPRAYRRLFLGAGPRRKSDQGRVLEFTPDRPLNGHEIWASMQSMQSLEDKAVAPILNLNTLSGEGEA
ncbi:deaminase [Streptomyces sp. R08]|uniref:Deaminase n=1 Tax=Streptomyces sp. R08 TaxID=3238624 RepID=A0AB39M3D2_9ACTN